MYFLILINCLKLLKKYIIFIINFILSFNKNLFFKKNKFKFNYSINILILWKINKTTKSYLKAARKEQNIVIIKVILHFIYKLFFSNFMKEEVDGNKINNDSV